MGITQGLVYYLFVYSLLLCLFALYALLNSFVFLG